MRRKVKAIRGNKRQKQEPTRSKELIPSPYPPYPDRNTWARLINQREHILRDLILSAVSEDMSLVGKLIERYGPYEVQYVLQRQQETLNASSMLTDEAAVYRRYRQLYAQFGCDKPFLSGQAYDTVAESEVKSTLNAMAKLFSFSRSTKVEESVRLKHLIYATDITPPAVPPKPADFTAPSPRNYSETVEPLLDIGWQLDEATTKSHLRGGRAHWAKVVPELTQMATDPGLINGWPGEKASWAPYHALNLLAYVRNPEPATALIGLLQIEDDWLSDRLPNVWAKMGPEAATPVWQALESLAYSDDKLAVLVAGLLAIVQAHSNQTQTIVQRFITLLENSPAERADLNAYLIYALDEIGDDTAVPAIENAMEAERVNTSIIGYDSIRLLGAALDW
jgi:hypothetical protein